MIAQAGDGMFNISLKCSTLDHSATALPYFFTEELKNPFICRSKPISVYLCSYDSKLSPFLFEAVLECNFDLIVSHAV